MHLPHAPLLYFSSIHPPTTHSAHTTFSPTQRHHSNLFHHLEYTHIHSTQKHTHTPEAWKDSKKKKSRASSSRPSTWRSLRVSADTCMCMRSKAHTIWCVRMRLYVQGARDSIFLHNTEASNIYTTSHSFTHTHAPYTGVRAAVGAGCLAGAGVFAADRLSPW